jgi:peroxiredoxin
MSNALRSRASSSTVHTRRPATMVLAVSAAIAVLAASTLIGIVLWPHAQSAPFTALAVGARAPRVELANASAAGASAALPATGEATLVSFLATQPDTASTPSRSQAVELVSLFSQYAAKGLHVEIVDESAASSTLNALENTVYDWQLGKIPLLADPGHSAANRYGVTTAPTTLLIGRNGKVLARWNGYVLTAAAAQAVTSALVEGPVS